MSLISDSKLEVPFTDSKYIIKPIKQGDTYYLNNLFRNFIYIYILDILFHHIRQLITFDISSNLELSTYSDDIPPVINSATYSFI
jgi:hypothetical protein